MAVSSGTPERVPFYRNVKLIGYIAQVVFVIVLIIIAVTLYSNVTTALRRSNLPADFNFLDNRAGIPIAETPIPYTTSSPYWRAILIGFLNTLKVALVGVVLASLLGILIGVMRLSSNWLVRQIATIYIETIRNTPTAVQIVFWYTAVLLPLPPRVNNPVELPGGILFSNVGLALPWLYPSYRFGAWLPWLIGALVVLIALFVFRRRQIRLSERPGNAWLLPLGAALIVSVIGYFVAGSGSALPENLAVSYNADRGRGLTFMDENGNGTRERGESLASYAAVNVTLPEAQLETLSQNLNESGQRVYSVFRFPIIQESEAETIEVTFANPEDAERFRLDFTQYPSRGVVYEDRDGNGELSKGEELDASGERISGFGGVRILMNVTDYSRRVVADRDGAFRIPGFEAAQEETAEEEESSSGRFGVFGGGGSSADSEAALSANVELLPSEPLVYSRAFIPVSNYEGGLRLTINYLAILLALVIYTASFIAEIVRGGIQAVPKGQTEAAKALGLSSYQIFNLVVFPQALRIILPPMISQYLNLTKNSSLAPLAAYAELFVIATIVANQTGASIPIAIILIVSYLLISFVFAFVLNIVNDRIALVER